jgi:hypothetical protein
MKKRGNNMYDFLRSKLFKVAGLSLLIALAITITAWGTYAQSGGESDPIRCENKFENSSLSGCYGWKSEAFINNDSSQGTSGVGLMSFDGNGALVGTYSGVALGTPVSTAYAGNYTVNINGTGSLQFTDSGGNTEKFDFVIVNGSNELFLVNTRQDVQQTMIMKKQ